MFDLVIFVVQCESFPVCCPDMFVLYADSHGVAASKSNKEQILDQKRKASAVQAPSSLAKSTSIDESHTVATTKEDSKQKSASASSATKPSTTAAGKTPTKEHRGSSLATPDKSQIKKVEKATAIEEESDEDEEDEEDEEDSDEDDEEEDESEEEEEEEELPAKSSAAKVSATDKQEAKVLKGTTPQKQRAGDGKKAGVSVGD